MSDTFKKPTKLPNFFMPKYPSNRTSEKTCKYRSHYHVATGYENSGESFQSLSVSISLCFVTGYENSQRVFRVCPSLHAPCTLQFPESNVNLFLGPCRQLTRYDQELEKYVPISSDSDMRKIFGNVNYRMAFKRKLMREFANKKTAREVLTYVRYALFKRGYQKARCLSGHNPGGVNAKVPAANVSHFICVC